MTLQAVGLAVGRGQAPLFSGLDLRVEPGQAVHVRGANGRGKTSLLRVLCGLSRPWSGEVRWCGKGVDHRHDAFRADVLYIGHQASLKDELSALENVLFAQALAGQPISEEQGLKGLAEWGLLERAWQPARSLSQGQRRRVGLARLTASPAPRLIVLDEPFNALDQASVEQLSAQLDHLVSAGIALVYTSHLEGGWPSVQPQQLDLDHLSASRQEWA